MRHFASPAFWVEHAKLPESVRERADRNFNLLKDDYRHPSLHLKKVGHLWSVRIGLSHRALAKPVDEGLIWFWIGSHADYDKLTR